MADERRRIKRLDDRTAASVRGSQVVGSVSRAIEELVRNSVEGCAKSCVVTVGKSEISVSDDGVGIDPEAMPFIGTEYCSNSCPSCDSTSSNDSAGGKAGETLRSIASLCVEMKIETACRSGNNAVNLKRKLGVNEPSRTGSSGCIIRSEKVFKGGVVVSLNKSLGGATAIIPMLGHQTNEAKIGTTITIRGLFHRHIVRRKHQEKTSSNSTELAQIRKQLRLLALCYPNVAFELRNGYAGRDVDCSYKSPEWACKFTGPLASGLQVAGATSPSLRVESRALIPRLCEMYPNEFFAEHSVELALKEDLKSSSRKDITNFRAFGVLCAFEKGNGETVHSRGVGTVTINGRLATCSDKLADDILNQVRLCRGDKPNCSVHFFAHVSSTSGELVIKDSIAMISVPRLDRLRKFLKTMVAKGVLGSGQPMPSEARNWDSRSISNRSRSIGEKKVWQVTNIRENKIVTGKHISCSTSNTSVSTKKTDKNRPKVQKSALSPFSSVFLDNTQPEQPAMIKMRQPKARSYKDTSLLSFEDAFLDDSPNNETLNPAANGYGFDDFQDTAATSTLWTKQRVRGLERTIASITAKANENAGAVNDKISLTKEMLAKAEVIAQVEEKFIIIKTGNYLLCVDQHAADERVALEKLESALFNPEVKDDHMIHMTNKSMLVSDILKQRKFVPPRKISLSQKDMSTVNHHWSLLRKWKFIFEQLDEKTLAISGIPSVCGRLVRVGDFLDFVKELGHFAGGDIKPAFVKNILASNACRYAIMFGDALTHEKCVELIASLSKCEMCFICAHGRPSVIPLIDLNRSRPASEALINGKEKAALNDGILRFGPKRVIRRRLDSNNGARH